MAFSDQFSQEQIQEVLESGAVGIDLGTTYSAVAAISEAGIVEVITNSDGRTTTPSVVLFDEDGSTLVGEQAKVLGQGQPDRVVECAKRAMGMEGFEYEISGQIYTPIGISAIILKKLVADASERLRREVKSAVITTPAWFKNEARQATMEAGKMANLHVLGILSEPTAAALAYGIAGEVAKTVLVYDLGGGTFDVSLIRISEDGKIEEGVRLGDVELGGKDWDQTIIDRFCEAFESENRQELPADSDAYMTLGIEAEKAKIRLTEKNQTKIFVQHEGMKFTFKLTREDFEEWTTHLLARTEDTVNMALKQAGVNSDQIDMVLPVGGATRMPQVREMLERFLPGKVDHSVEKDHVVAIGACLYMAKKVMGIMDETGHSEKPGIGPGTATLAPKVSDRLRVIETVEVSPGTYGIEVLDHSDQPFNDHFVRANQELPVTEEKTYYTSIENQDTANVKLLMGDSKVVDECKPIATKDCHLPPGLPKASPLQFTFYFTTEGMIKVTLYEPTSGQTSELEREVGVTEEERQAVTNAMKAME